MSKNEKLLNRLLNRPKDFIYDELKQVLTKFGYVEQSGGKTTGSAVKFMHKDTNKPFFVHKPHPGKIVKMYVLDKLIETLKDDEII